MTRQEFEERTVITVTDEEWSKIQFVYTWHPSIDEVKGKDQIAMLVDTFGIRIIEDMLPTAQRAEEYVGKISSLRAQLQMANSEYAKFRRGEI